jgi:uncharacterized protein YbaA (DUF1428 family)
MTYVDGFITAVPNGNKAAFLEFAKAASALFKKYGALQQVECWGDSVPDGKLTSFSLAVKKAADETVVFSWVVWPSKTARDTGWAKMMEDPRMKPENLPMPFDGKRMIYGGFDVIFES